MERTGNGKDARRAGIFLIFRLTPNVFLRAMFVRVRVCACPWLMHHLPQVHHQEPAEGVRLPRHAGPPDPQEVGERLRPRGEGGQREGPAEAQVRQEGQAAPPASFAYPLSPGLTQVDAGGHDTDTESSARLCGYRTSLRGLCR